jgi:hypothetical protein
MLPSNEVSSFEMLTSCPGILWQVDEMFSIDFLGAANSAEPVVASKPGVARVFEDGDSNDEVRAEVAYAASGEVRSVLYNRL